MDAYVVDDEILACRILREMLVQTQSFGKIRTFTDSEEALEAAKKDQPGAAFLDIEMPGISGIELAEALQENDEQVQIIFTTAYNEYAVKAFELNAIDYLLKPILMSRLRQAVSRIIKNNRQSIRRVKPPAEQCGVECFGSLRFYRIDGDIKQYIPVKWRTSRARELYAFLLSEHDSFVSKEKLIDLFWSAIDAEKGSAQLYTTIYQIRQLMKQLPFRQSILKNSIGYSLILAPNVTIDTEKWEKKLTVLPPIDDTNYIAHIHLFQAYKNHYFAEYDYLWAEAGRMHLCRLWLDHAYRILDFLIDRQAFSEALGICEQIMRLEPDDERTISYQIKLYNAIGSVEDVIRIYERYKRVKDAVKHRPKRKKSK